MEDNKKNEVQKETKGNKTKPIRVGKESIIILRHRSIDTSKVEEFEQKYSEKFGCKVIILESNLDYVGKIDG